MDTTVQLEDLPAARTLVVRGHCAFEEIGQFLGPAFAETAEIAGRQGAGLAGPPFGRYQMADGGWEVEAGFPVRGEPAGQGRVEVGELPAGQAATIVHAGPYAEVGAAHRALEQWATNHGYVTTGLAWECYLDEPTVPNPRTKVFLPCGRAADRT